MNRAPIRTSHDSRSSLGARGASRQLASRAGAPRSFARRLGAALALTAAALVLGGACGDDPAKETELGADAGPACERGTRNCACIGGSGCRDDLLCIAGRCQVMTDVEPPTTTPRPRPRPELPDPGDPDPDAGGAPPDDSADASADASVSSGDAGDDAE